MNLLKPFLTIHEKFSYLICGFSQAFKKIKPMCYIDNIDTIRKTVSIHGLGMTSNFKFHFKDIINDYVILSNLSSLHSSWIGYYYGLYYVELLHSTDGSSQNITRFNFPSNDSKKRFKLLIQKRNGQISYLDRIKNQEYSADIIILLSSPKILCDFDPIEACYLGILGGIYSANRKRSKVVAHSHEKKANLYLVK